MAKEWVLNQATNRWGLNKKSSVGPTSQWIRECDPSTVEEWEEGYLKRLSNMLAEKGINLSADQYLQGLGDKLYVKISEVVQSEIEEVTQEDCKQYIRHLVLNRTFDGYWTEIKTVYGQLAKALDIELHAAPDDWDRQYNVDFFTEVNSVPIGFQIKPITYDQKPELHQWKQWLAETHDDFYQTYGGKVFTVFSSGSASEKSIVNPEVIEDIQREIARLQKEQGNR